MTIEILDTHQHLIYADRFGYQWTDPIPALAGRSFTYADYRHAAANTGISSTLFMEATSEDWRPETDMVQEMVENPDMIVSGIIAGCRPEKPDFDAWLDAIADRPVAGMRRILHVMPDELSQDDLFRSNIRKLASRGLTFDLCFLGRQLAVAADLAGSCENVQFILDHCGVPDIAAGDMDPWRERISTLAAMPNVACKISGVTAYTKSGRAPSRLFVHGSSTVLNVLAGIALSGGVIGQSAISTPVSPNGLRSRARSFQARICKTRSSSSATTPSASMD